MKRASFDVFSLCIIVKKKLSFDHAHEISKHVKMGKSLNSY